MAKYFGVNDDGSPAFLDAPFPAVSASDSAHEHCKILMKRVKHAFYDWLWARKQQSPKYKSIAQSDLENLLVSLDDLITFIKDCPKTDKEAAEVDAFINSLKG